MRFPYTRLICIIQEYDMPKAKSKALYDAFRYLCRFTVEADCIEPVRIQREHIFFPTCNEEHISFGGNLLHAETIGHRHPPTIEKADFRTVRAIYLDIAISNIGEYRFCRRTVKLKLLTFSRYALIPFKTPYPKKPKCIFMDTIMRPIVHQSIVKRLYLKTVWTFFRTLGYISLRSGDDSFFIIAVR